MLHLNEGFLGRMRNDGTLEVWYIICYKFVLKWLNWECWLTCGDYMNMDMVVLSLGIVLEIILKWEIRILITMGILCGSIESGRNIALCY